MSSLSRDNVIAIIITIGVFDEVTLLGIIFSQAVELQQEVEVGVTLLHHFSESGISVSSCAVQT